MMGNELGSIEKGKLADIIFIDVDQPHIMPTHNLPATIIEAVNSGDVKHSIINGKIIMKNRKVLTLDEDKIMYESKKTMAEISKKAGF